MDKTVTCSKQDIIAYIKDQIAIIQENRGPFNLKDTSLVARRRAYNPTPEDEKWIDANLNISIAIMEACENFSTWHTSRMRTAVGMDKMAWSFYQRPDKAAHPFEIGTKEALLEIIHVWMHFEPFMIQSSENNIDINAFNNLLGDIEIDL